jgi:hypothetical protein
MGVYRDSFIGFEHLLCPLLSVYCFCSLTTRHEVRPLGQSRTECILGEVGVFEIRGYTGTQCTCDWYTNTGTQCTWHVYVYVRTMLPHHCKVVSQLCTTTIMLCHILDVLFEIMFFVRTRHVYVLASAHTTADIGKRYAGHRSQITTPRSSWRT